MLRSSSIELMGSGIGSVSLERLLASINEVFKAAVPAGFKILTEAVPLAKVSQTWNAQNNSRVVFVTES